MDNVKRVTAKKMNKLAKSKRYFVYTVNKEAFENFVERNHNFKYYVCPGAIAPIYRVAIKAR